MKKQLPAGFVRAVLALAWGGVWFCLFLLMSRLSVAVVPKAFAPLLATGLTVPILFLLPDTLLPDAAPGQSRARQAARHISLRAVTPAQAFCAVVCGSALNFAVCGALELLPIPDTVIDAYNTSASQLSDRTFAAMFSVVLLSPLWEELIFRGLILGSFRRGLPVWAALPLSAALFAVCHAGPVWMAYAFVNGLLLGALMLAGKSVLPALLCHIAFNVANYVRIPLFPSTGRTGAAVMLAAGLLLAAAAFCLFLKFSKSADSGAGSRDTGKEI